MRERVWMQRFYDATGLGALQHWPAYSIWKAQQQKGKRAKAQRTR